MSKYVLWDHCFERPSADSDEVRSVAARLRRTGMSEAGAGQLLAGRPVADVRDRQYVSAFLHQALDLAAEVPSVQIGMLLPAIQKVRASAGSTKPASTLQGLGLSAAGAAGAVGALPLHHTADRTLLARLVVRSTPAGPAAGHRSPIRMALGDGSVR